MQIKHIKNLSIFMTIVLTILISSGCSEKPTSREITGLIFQVEKDGKLSYLMGSIHYSKDYITFTEKTEEAYTKADRIAVEIDITDPKLSEQLNEDISYSSDDTLDNHITQQTKEYLTPILKEINLPYDKIKNFKPWAVVSIITNAQLQSLDYYSGRGLDITLINRAKTDNKEIYSLETIDEQMKGVEFDKSDEFGNSILQDCNELNRVQNQLDDMTEAVYNGEAETVEEINKSESMKYQEGILKEWYSYLVYERNVNLAERIDKLFEEDKTTLAVVGAGHLTDDKGIISLLESKGYKITQIK